METAASANSRAALLGGNLGLASVVLVGIGAGGAGAGVLPPLGGFLLMVLGLGIGLVAIVTSVIGIVKTAGGAAGGRAQAVRGLALSLLVVVSLGVAASRGSGVPRINDITTDVSDPPVFVVATGHGPNQGRDMAYPGASFASQQQAGYPDLASLVLDVAPDAAFDRVRAALAAMPRMEITGEDRTAGTLEATQTSRLFHFADDVVVRIRPFEDGGSRVDVRSKSRDGKGDMGVNAARIREIFARVKGSAASPSAE